MSQGLDSELEATKGIATRERAPSEQSAQERCYLLVFESGSSSIFHVPQNGEVIIGRSEDAHLRLIDASVSRNHAKITTSDGEARILDLKSHNGTRVNGERVVSMRALTSGDVVLCGAVTLVFHRDAKLPTRRPVLELVHLRQRLEEEIERSLRYQRPVTLLAVELGGSGAVDRSRVANALVGQLRLIDVVAWGGETLLLALLPEVGSDVAMVPAERLLQALGPLCASAKAGFSTCPTDGCDVDTLLASARAAAKTAQAGHVAPASEAATTIQLGNRSIVAADPAMIRLFALVERLASSDLPILVTGETGVGKEIVATAIHERSPRHDHPLVAINCAAIAENLLESELFGYEKGAFSGADTAKPGLLESAAGGTVFLDEVGELSASAQAKLLRVLETKRVSRLGSVKEKEIDARVVAATNRRLDEDVQSGRFREDLFFRLSAATIILPPLRDRKHDLPILARTFLTEACARQGRPAMAISPGAMQMLAVYRWPGNVRELKNLMAYVAATANDPILEPWLLPERITQAAGSAAQVSREGSGFGREEETGSSFGGGTADFPSDASATGGVFRNIYDEISELERSRMTAAIESAGGVQVRAAEMIGMPLRTFVTKLKLYNITYTANRRRTRPPT